jgi:tetratricopeptide (TPR) repeat protein
MKFVSGIVGLLLGLTLFTGCAHQKASKELHFSELTPEQMDYLNQEALTVISKRLEEMVVKAKTNQSAVDFLSTDLFLKANMSLLEGDFKTAAVLFKHLVELVPKDQFLQKKYAIALIRDGDLDTAQTVLKQLYQTSADEKVGLILAGVYSGLDKELQARELYQRLLKSNPKNEDACIFLGKSLAVDKKSQEAIRHLVKCSMADKQNGMYHYFMGKIYLDLGQVPQAMASFKIALSRQPTLAQAASALGTLLEERERHDEAIKTYAKFLIKSPHDSTVLNRIVQGLFMQERFNEVIPYAERLADLEPDNLNLKVKLGILYTDAKRYSEAVSIFKDLLAASQQSDKILYYLGAIYQEMNQFQESIEYFNQIPSSSGLYTDSSVQMANMLSTLAQAEVNEKLGTGYKDRFLKFLNSKIEEFKDMRVEFSVIKAGFYEGTGQYKDAMDCLMVVQDEKNFTTQHKYYLANLYEKEKRFSDSEALIRSILEKDPKNAHAWNFLGYSLVVRGEQLDKAYEYIQIALRISPQDGYIRDSLGWYYFKKGDISLALAELELAAKKIPDDIEILKHLAEVHRELKNFKRAKSYYESALKYVRYHSERQEILTQLEQLDTDRIPATEKID